MFGLGQAGGRSKPGWIGASPGWFYKGTGRIVRAHNELLTVSTHALEGDKKAELVGIYVVGSNGIPFRLGMAQANEISDHLLESKTISISPNRNCAIAR